MDNELIYDEATGEWIDPEAIRQEGEELERSEAARFADWCKLERALANGAFDGGDDLSDPFAG